MSYSLCSPHPLTSTQTYCFVFTLLTASGMCPGVPDLPHSTEVSGSSLDLPQSLALISILMYRFMSTPLTDIEKSLSFPNL